MKFILSIMLLIASIFLAQSAFAMDVQIQEALTPPDVLIGVSAILAPDMTSEFIYQVSPMVTPSANVSGHLSYNILNSHETGLYTTYLIDGFRDKFQGVETVLKFPYLIQSNILNDIKNLEVGLVS